MRRTLIGLSLTAALAGAAQAQVAPAPTPPLGGHLTAQTWPDAGRTNGGALLTTWRGAPTFRAELEALRKTGAKLDAAMCKAEAEQTAKTPW